MSRWLRVLHKRGLAMEKFLLDERLSLNILVLGQTGVGKSSLINYLIGREAVKAGTGKPVTPKGEFENIIIPTERNLDYKIFDSWGLEAKEADVWKKTIKEKLEKGCGTESANNFTGSTSFSSLFAGVPLINILNQTSEKNKLTLAENVNNNIHAVLYCISYTSSSIEDFEIETIKEVLSLGFKVIIVFTQADSNQKKEREEPYRDRLNTKLSEYNGKYSFVDVAANPVKKLGQKTSTSAFGKEELEKVVFENVWENILNRSFANWENLMISGLDDHRNSHLSMIKDLSVTGDFGDHFKFKTNRANEVIKKLENDLKKFTEEVDSSLKNMCTNLLKYYDALYERVTSRTLSFKNPDLNISTDVKQHYDGTDFWAHAVIKMIPIIRLPFALLEKSILSDEIKEKYDDTIVNAKEQIKTICHDTHEKMRDIFAL